MSRIMSLKFWDVQHGNATHLITPNGRVVVIDLGDADSPSGVGRFSPINHLRYTQGFSSIDKLIITHPHRDHLDDIENAVSMSPRVLLRPNWLSESDVSQGNRPADSTKVLQYLSLSSRYTEVVKRPNSAAFTDDWGGVRMTHYQSRNVPRSNLNNHSIVSFFEFAGLTALVPGDNESPSWKQLLEDNTFRAELARVDVLLAPHHGREAGYCSELFDAGLQPRLTVISDDQQGSTSVTERYAGRTRGWTVYDLNGNWEKRLCVTTRRDGNIWVQFGLNDDGTTFLHVKTGV